MSSNVTESGEESEVSVTDQSRSGLSGRNVAQVMTVAYMATERTIRKLCEPGEGNAAHNSKLGTNRGTTVEQNTVKQDEKP
jgi:hypothetical protein